MPPTMQNPPAPGRDTCVRARTFTAIRLPSVLFSIVTVVASRPPAARDHVIVRHQQLVGYEESAASRAGIAELRPHEDDGLVGQFGSVGRPARNRAHELECSGRAAAADLAEQAWCSSRRGAHDRPDLGALSLQLGNLLFERTIDVLHASGAADQSGPDPARRSSRAGEHRVSAAPPALRRPEDRRQAAQSTGDVSSMTSVAATGAAGSLAALLDLSGGSCLRSVARLGGTARLGARSLLATAW